MTTDDLATWLLEQIAEDERDTRRAREDAAVVDHRAGLDPDEFDPYMVNLDAKRRIIDEYAKAMAQRKAHPDDLPTSGWLLGTIRALKLLALPYADRPGYREEWKPLVTG